MFLKNLIKKKQTKELIEYLTNHCYMISPTNNISIWYKNSFFNSKCHKEEIFNIKKGLLVCLSKMAGYNYSDIKEKLLIRGCSDSDKTELFYLYDIVYDAFGISESDVDFLSKNIEIVG